MTRIKRLFVSVVLPVSIALVAALLFKAVYMRPEGINYLLMWICIGIPFGIHRMCLWLVPTKFDLAGTVGIIFLNVLVGGIIGGFALVYQVLKGTVQTIIGS